MTIISFLSDEKRLLRLLIISLILLFAFTPFKTSAIVISSPTGTVGSIGIGNDYLPNETSFCGGFAEKNMYLLIESTQISFACESTTSTAAIAYNAVGKTLRSALVAADHNLYILQSDGIYLRTGGYSPTIVDSSNYTKLYSSLNIYTIKELNGNIYFLDGTALKHIRLDNLQSYSDFTVANQNNGNFIIFLKSNMVTVLTTVANQHFVYTYFTNATTSSNINTYTDCYGGSQLTYTSYLGGYFTENYIFARIGQSATSSSYYERIFYKNNYTVYFSGACSTPSYTSGSWISESGNVELGERSTTMLYGSQSDNTYSTAGFLEKGTSNTFIPGELIYDVASLQSLYTSYYNNSPIIIQYQIQFQISDTDYNNKKDILDWRIDLIDGNNTKIANSNIIMYCTYNGFLTYTWTCKNYGSVTFQPITAWKAGNYSTKLYEANISSGANALLDTDTFEVLSTAGQLVLPSTTSSNNVQQTTDNLLSSGFIAALIIFCAFASIGFAAGGGAGAGLGFAAGFIVSAAYGLVPQWAIILFAVVVILGMSVMIGRKIGGGSD